MNCIKCGGDIIGDGYTSVQHCENAAEETYEFHEPDAYIVYCSFVSSDTPEVDKMNTIYWKNNLLKTIDCLYLSGLNTINTYNVEYCTGVTQTDERVKVTLPFKKLTKGKVKEEILSFAKDENVFAKGIGIFDAITIKES